MNACLRTSCKHDEQITPLFQSHRIARWCFYILLVLMIVGTNSVRSQAPQDAGSTLNTQSGLLALDRESSARYIVRKPRLVIQRSRRASNSDNTPSAAIPCNESMPPVQNDKETAIIIMSSLIPSHPSLDILNQTIQSLDHLKGLSSNAPIYIVVDMLPSYAEEEVSIRTKPVYQRQQEERLDMYVTTLYEVFLNQPKFHIIVNAIHQDTGGSMKKIIPLLDPQTKFLYYVQQDIMFIEDVDHTALVETIDKYSDIVHLVQFQSPENSYDSANTVKCWKETPTNNLVANVNGIHLTKIWQWSSQSHFTTVAHYKEILANILNGSNRMNMELGVNQAIEHDDADCKHFIQYAPHFYGKNGDHPRTIHVTSGSFSILQ